MANCEQFTELISLDLDGQLSSEEQQALSQHLSQCGQCRALSAELRSISSMMHELEDIAPPVDLTALVMDRVHAEKKPAPLFRRRYVRQIAGFAACAVLFVGVYQSTQRLSGGGIDTCDGLTDTIPSAAPPLVAAQGILPEQATAFSAAKEEMAEEAADEDISRSIQTDYLGDTQPMQTYASVSADDSMLQYAAIAETFLGEAPACTVVLLTPPAEPYADASWITTDDYFCLEMTAQQVDELLATLAPEDYLLYDNFIDGRCVTLYQQTESIP